MHSAVGDTIEQHSVSPLPSSLKAQEPILLSHLKANTTYVPSTWSSHIDEQAIKTWTQGEITMWLTMYSLV